MKNIIIYFLIFLLSLMGCNPNINPEQHRQVMIFFSTRSPSVSLLKSTANDAENIIAKIKLFGVNDHGKVVESFPVMDNVNRFETYHI